MAILQIDLGGYLATRRKMRLLPNMFDGGKLAAFDPIFRMHKFLRVVEPFSFTSAVIFYLLLALLYAIAAIAINAKIKSLVLSDSRRTVTVIGLSFLTFGVAEAIVLPDGFGFILAPILGIGVYAAFIYLRRLNGLKNHPVYRCLVGVKRRSLTYATTRYAFFSRQSFQVYWTILLGFWKAYLAYISFGIFMLLFIVTATKIEPWLSSMHGIIQVVVGVGLVLFLRKIANETQHFVANKITQFVRELRSRLARSASALAEKDNRAPILLLRSFRDDGILVENERFWGDKLLGINKRVRLEEVIAETLYPYGPLIALSNPEDELPPLGAAKENVADCHWQLKVQQYMRQAWKIVFIVGNTPSLRWEINQILSSGLLEKCLFVFPPKDHSRDENSRLLVHCLPELARELGFLGEEETSVLPDALLLAVRQQESVVITARNGDTGLGYAEALRMAILHVNGLKSPLFGAI
jgi:hypothetical protein